MNFITFSKQEFKEYNDFVDSIPELQQQLLEASQTFLRPKNYHQNNAALEIQKAWRLHRIQKLRKPDPDMASLGPGVSEYDMYINMMDQPIDSVKDIFVKTLRNSILKHERLLGNESIRVHEKTFHNISIQKLRSKLRQVITYKMIFEYSKKYSSDEDLLLHYDELQRQRKLSIDLL